MSFPSIESDFQFLNHLVEELSIKSSLSELQDDDERVIKDVDIYGLRATSSEEHYLGEIGLSLQFACSKKGHAEEEIVIELKIIGRFIASIESMTTDDFKKMLLGNGTATLYSIARAIISTTTAQCMSSGQVRIPMINVLKFLATTDDEPQIEE